MSKSFYVYSTLTADNLYLNHEGSANDIPIAVGSGIMIRGGAGLAGRNLVTPRGVVNGPFSEEEIEYLRRQPVFQLHEANGFIHIDTTKVDADQVAADMTSRDGGAPLVDADFPEGDAPTTEIPEGGKAEAQHVSRRVKK
jgi:hypothetical protein